jgi:hypothetical protein
MKEIFALLLVLWLSCFGFAMILQQHRPFWNWTVRMVRAALRFFRNQLARFARWAWANYRQYILGLASGILLTLWLTGRLP